MRVTPKTDQELEQAGLMPEGMYQFEVVDAEETVSKNGNEMIKLQLSVMDHENKPRLMFDFLLDVMAKKLKHFAKAVNILDKYESQLITSADCYKKKGVVHIGIEPGKPNPAGGNYPARNCVLDYLPDNKQPEPAADGVIVETSHPAFDNDIPF